jgi:hypothetical protein
MALTLYRRHRKECEGGHAEDSRSGEFEEGRRGWKKCGCLIHISGTLGGQFSRKQTGKTNWEEAKAVAVVWESALSWDGQTKIEESVAPASQLAASERLTIQRAIEEFTREFEEYAAPNTQKKYRLILQKLKRFSESKGYVLLEQWGPTDVREFRSSWSVSLQTAAKNMSIVKAFFEFCLSNEWILRNPARLVKNRRGRDAADRRSEQKLPFSDEELRKMYEACGTKYGKQEIKWSRVIHHRPAEGEYTRYNQKWTGQDVADFISVSLYTGLRISDVSTFHIDRLQPTGHMFTRGFPSGCKNAFAPALVRSVPTSSGTTQPQTWMS